MWRRHGRGAPETLAGTLLRRVLGRGRGGRGAQRAPDVPAAQPIPALRRSFRLHPDDEADPWVFRVDLADPWGKGAYRVAFRREASGGSVTETVRRLPPPAA
jgi:hypothetical protein